MKPRTFTLFPSAEELETRLHPHKNENWKELLILRREVLKDLEAARNLKKISGSLEAKVKLMSKGPLLEILNEYRSWLPGIFIVSQVEVAEFDGPVRGDDPFPFHIEVLRADGKKCERCWNYSTHVGENADYPTVCERCVKALGEIERERGASGLGAAS